MKFKNYCVVIMGEKVEDVSKVLTEIEKISDSQPNVLNAKGVIIATFTSFVDIKEITAWFTLNKRNFFAFDLDPDKSGYSFLKEDIHEGLFGFLNKNTEKDLELRTLDLLNSFKNNVSNVKEKEVRAKQITEADIAQMTILERQQLMDSLIEKGIVNLTENDKKILPLLAK